jgi:hypothetical protein
MVHPGTSVTLFPNGNIIGNKAVGVYFAIIAHGNVGAYVSKRAYVRHRYQFAQMGE